jgi:putative transposase
MPRGPRRDAPGAVHHVLLRGIERRQIFYDDQDRENFLDRLSQQIEQGHGSCLAWSLMPNHSHLVLRTGDRPLSSVMARLNGGYARWFNYRHARSGYLFQNRFRSIVVSEDVYLRLLVRYVHLNPFRARLVETLAGLEHYPWTGHAALMGRVERPFQAVGEVLGWFGSTAYESRPRLVHWMSQGIGEDQKGSPLLPISRIEPKPLHPTGAIQPPDVSPRELRARSLRLAGWDLTAVLLWVCRELDADPSAVCAGRKTTPERRARALVAHIVVEQLCIPARRIAPNLGVSSGAVSRAITRGRALAVDLGLRLPEQSPNP